MDRASISGRSLALSKVYGPCVAAGLYYLLSVLTIILTSGDTGVSAIWPANAVLLGMMVLRPRDRWWPIIAAGALASTAANCTIHGPSVSGLLFGAANLVEVVVAAWAIARFVPSRDELMASTRNMARFLFWAGGVAPAIAATIGASVFHSYFGKPFGQSALLWFFADALGLLTFTPFFYALFSGRDTLTLMGLTSRKRVEAVVLLLLTAGVATIVFLAHRPLLFFITMPTMLVAFRIGWIGVRVACIIVAVIGCITTAAGLGPLVHTTPDPAIRILSLQIFLAAQLMIQWPVAAALSVRDHLMEQLSKSERSLRFLASQSSVLMLTFDVAGLCRKAVGAQDLLPMIAVDDMPGLMVEELSAVAGRALREAHDMAIDMGDGMHSAEFRVHGAQGGRWLEATFRAREDENGRCPGTVMTLHDISVRKEQAIALTRTAHTDSLTGLYNRAGFLKRLERELASAPSGTLSLAMIDVDRFKLVNDSCGHQTGDAVLTEIARRISGQLRPTDFVGRMGGDEFVVFLNTPDWSKAQDICARLVRAVGAEPVRVSSGQTINTAISCGVARHQPGLSMQQFLHDADIALYEAKRAGRNQMVAA